MASPDGTPSLHDAAVRSRVDAGGGLVLVSLEPPPQIASTYERPGQYVLLRAGGKSSYFVLASDVGDMKWDLLVRAKGEAATAALAARVGESLQVSAALGSGFPMEEARGRPLLVAVTGSAVAAARPVVRARLGTEQARSTEVLVGVRSRVEVSLASEIARWSHEGARVTVCLSREEVGTPKEGYAAGYVQHVARTILTPHSDRMIFTAGAKGMVSALRSMAGDLGVLESDVRTNF